MLTPPNGSSLVPRLTFSEAVTVWSGNEAVYLKGPARAYPSCGLFIFAAELWEKISMNGLDELFEQILHSERNFKARINKLRECKPSFY